MFLFHNLPDEYSILRKDNKKFNLVMQLDLTPIIVKRSILNDFAHYQKIISHYYRQKKKMHTLAHFILVMSYICLK